MKFVFEIDLTDENHTAGYVAGYLLSLTEGMMDHFDADQDFRSSRVLHECGEMIICEGGVYDNETKCGVRIHIVDQPFDTELRSLRQVAEHDGMAMREEREIPVYTEKENASSDPS